MNSISEYLKLITNLITKNPELLSASLFIGLYYAIVVLTQHFLIFRPIREITSTELSNLKELIESLQESDPGTSKENLQLSAEINSKTCRNHKCLKNSILKILNQAEEKLKHCGFCLAGSKEMLAWRSIHRAERELVYLLSLDRLLAILHVARSRIKELPEDMQVYWNKEFDKLDKLVESSNFTKCDIAHFRAVLQGFLSIQYEVRDTEYARLLVVHRKMMFLLLASFLSSLFIIYFWNAKGLIPSVSPSYLYVAGFVGGLLSRLTRFIHRGSLPNDYGAYWISIFLAPAIGALASLAGIMLLSAAVKSGLLGNVVEELFKGSQVYGLGVVLGFSEKLFSGLSKKLEDRLLRKEDKNSDRKEGKNTEEPKDRVEDQARQTN